MKSNNQYLKHNPRPYGQRANDTLAHAEAA